ncbi:M56 family metallopeptidase [Pseudoteredinibacter isoporae]|uniref:Beta-lactamase regulating signal transducer with metallopeptidase domain n=1 Tax=Pseudoteredinibacter isoporae TaxID=570281 RepID=A0A7X0JQM6_9GAMM|nr:M56 family metallopeptidase [Pseudoteredinibacter isoporae]MBB6520494.1 beta-lactamase regulating signal transducer with metallopeptidase domain [Pseudoteredinibacter isoporae]NHO86061.1 M56 family metallopeptidase [Pseudoteredinibacter isoporae]NIB25488.1 M56 family metallopeptidase [Pseudoteredinibacter isoporae]
MMTAALLMFPVKAALVGLLFIGCYYGLDKHSARLRYQWLSTISVLFLLFPILDQLLNSFDVTVAVRTNHLLLRSGAELLQEPWLQIGLLLYCFICSWLLFYVFLGLSQLSRYRKSAQTAPLELQQLLDKLSARIGLLNVPELKLHHNNAMSPCTFGSLNPVVLLPANAVDWPKEQLELVLLHELAHVKHRDFLRLNGARFLLAFYWFLPPAWWLLAELKKLSEQLADDTVLNVGANDADYAEVLMRAGRLHKEASSMAVAVNGNGEYYQRVMTVLDRYVDRTAQPNKASRPLFWFLILSTFSAAAIDLSVENKGYLKLPVEMVSIQKFRDAPVAGAVEENVGWDESLKVVAMAAEKAPTAERSTRFEMSGYLAGDIELPSAQLFEGINKDIDIRANFNIDEKGRAYAVKIKPQDLETELREEISNAIKNSQFAVHRLNGEPVVVTGAEQRYQLKEKPKKEKASKKEDKPMRDIKMKKDAIKPAEKNKFSSNTRKLSEEV